MLGRVVDSYAQIIDVIQRTMQGSKTGEVYDMMRRVYPLLCEARVFSIGSSLYQSASQSSPSMMDDLPFQSVLFVYPEPIKMSWDETEDLASDVQNLDMYRAAHLLVGDGRVFAFFMAQVGVDGSMALSVVEVNDGHKWVDDRIGKNDSITIPALVRTINSYQTISDPESRSSVKREMRRRGHGKRRPPPDLYIVPLRQQIVSEKTTGGAQRGAQGYRSDVRGHYRLRVVRGQSPISEKKAKDLTEKGYRILTSPVIGDDEERLYLRGIRRPGDGEWMAIKKTWVRAYVRGPEGAPHIQAIRVVPS